MQQETREAEAATIDKAVAAWLGWILTRRSRSEQTWEGYGRVLRDFRTYLRTHGRDLDPYQGLPETATEAERRSTINEFADLIGEHLTTTLSGKRRAESSYNRAWSILHGFYAFAIRKDYLFCSNPVTKVDRVTVQTYRASRSLNLADVATAMRAIDRATLIGARDYALLSVFLETGRRCSEVLNLTWGDVTKRADGRIELCFVRTKGGATRRNTLTADTSAAVCSWIERVYSGHTLTQEVTLWPSLGHSAWAKGQLHALHRVDVSRMCEKRLGTTNLHRLRHTFAYSMYRAGAPLEDIKLAMGHRSIATTEIYVRSLDAPENRYAEQIATLLGMKQ